MRFDGGIRQVATPLIPEGLAPLQEHCHTIQFSERLTDEPLELRRPQGSGGAQEPRILIGEQ